MSLNFLTTVSLFDLTKVSHHAIQLVRQWARASLSEDRLAVREDATLTSEQIELIRRVVESIEQAEGAKLDTLPDDRVDHYVTELSSLLQEATRQQLHTSPARGQMLLMQLREQVPRKPEAV